MKGSLIRRLVVALASAAVLFAISGCRLNVEKDDNGKEKKVDVQTPIGELKVRTDDVQARDTGLPVYPGAQPKPKKEHDESKANVNIDTPFFGLKVVALTFTSQDPADKVVGWYRDQMKGSNNFVECRGKIKEGRKKDDDDLQKPVSCDGHIRVKGKDSDLIETSDDTIELKTGTNGNQHVVAVKPTSGGSEFSLVYVRIHGRDKGDSI